MPGWLFSTHTPWRVRKITSPPSGVERRRTREKNGGGVCVRVSRLSAWRLAVLGTARRCIPAKFLKSSTYNIHFKSYLVLRV